MDKVNIEHIIYAPVPYKGYSIRAKSRGANIDSFLKAFKEWLIPFDQNIITSGFFERVLVMENDKIYLARVFQASELDELRRSGVVSHIAQLDASLFSKVPISIVDSVMADFIKEKGVPMGELDSLNVSLDFKEDNEFNVLREVVHKETIQRILELSLEEKFKIFIVYKGSERDALSFGLTRIISATSPTARRSSIVVSEKIKSDILLLYNGVLVIGKRLPPWARIRGWNIINLERQEVARATSKITINDILKQIYG